VISRAKKELVNSQNRFALLFSTLDYNSVKEKKKRGKIDSGFACQKKINQSTRQMESGHWIATNFFLANRWKKFRASPGDSLEKSKKKSLSFHIFYFFLSFALLSSTNSIRPNLVVAKILTDI
jgi:hypothetical protein